DRTGWHADLLQRFEPIIACPRFHSFSQQWNQYLAINHAIGIGFVTDVLGQGGTADDMAISLELGVVSHGYDKMAVGCRKYLIGHKILMCVACPSRSGASGEVVKILVGEHGHLAIEQRHIDMLAQAAASPLVQGSQ